MFSNKVLRINFSNRTFKIDECCQIEFVRCYAFCDEGRYYYNMRNDYDVENVFSCEGDSEVDF